MPKYSGLSHLAEQARRDGLQILHSYPIKQKRQPRRLNPNLAGIEWLESDANHFDEDTKIEAVVAMDDTAGELIVGYAHGRGAKSYNRPMIQIIPRDAFSGSALSCTPCPGCYDFARTWACPDHAERHYDTDNKAWRIVHTDDLDCECEACQPATGCARAADAVGGSSSVGPSAPEAYRRIVAATEPTPLDPVEGNGTGSIQGILHLAFPRDYLEITGDTVQIEVGRPPTPSGGWSERTP